MTREEFERADEIVEEVDRLSDLVDAFAKIDDAPSVEIRLSKIVTYYFNNKTPLGKSILESIEEAVNKYVNNLEEEFEKL